MKKILVTGGIGSGKTTVCNIFRELGIPVYSSDLHVDEVIDTNPEVILRIKELFGEDSYKDGALDKQEMSNILIKDEGGINKLNQALEGIGIVSLLSVVPGWNKSITMKIIVFTAHPNVGGKFDEWCKNQNSDFVIVESSSAIELGLEDSFDYIIGISSSDENRVNRVVARDKCIQEIARARMDNQIPEEEVLKHSDHIIINNDFDDLESQVRLIHKNIIDTVNSKL